MFGLHNNGDARAWYLLSKNRLVLEVVMPERAQKKDQVFEQFRKIVAKVLDRPTELVMVDSIPTGTLTESGLKAIVEEKMRHAFPGDGTLFVVLADDYMGHEDTELGRTYKEFGILISNQALEQQSGGSKTYEKYLLTTLLHEFGHQLGLPHTENTSCIMLPHARQFRVREDWYADSVPEGFCEEELSAISNIKARLQ
jgi:predicted Zn-dependent protease